jgi:WD40 repeat protein
MLVRGALSALVVLSVAGPLVGQPHADLDGQPLPPEAVARLGSVRLRAPMEILGLAFSPDGKRLVSRTTSSMQIWDVADGRKLWGAGELHHRCDAVCFLDEGRLAITSCYVEHIGVWDTAKGEQVRKYPLLFKRVIGVSGDPRGTVFAVATQDGEIHVGDAAKDGSLKLLTKTGVENTVTALSRDGHWLAVAAPNADIDLWDLDSSKKVRSITVKGQVLHLAFTPDRALVAVTEKQTLLFDAAGKVLRAFASPVANPVALWLSDDGKQLAVAGQHAPTVVRWWDLATGKVLREFKDGRTTRVSAVAPDGRTVALSFWDQRIELWDAETGKPRLTSPGHGRLIDHVTFLPDGRHVATAASDRLVCVWDLAGKLCRTFEHSDPYLAEAYRCFAADGKLLLTREPPGEIAVWDLTTGKTRRFRVPTTESFELRDVAESGETVVLRTTTSVLLWDVGAPEFRLRIKPLHFPNMAILSPDQRWLFIRETVYTHLWDADTGRHVRQLVVGDHRWTFQGFTPDGRQLVMAVSSRKDKDKEWTSPLVWSDAHNGDVLAEVPVRAYLHSGSVFSPDGRLLAAAAFEGGIVLYETRTRLPLGEIATPKTPNDGHRQIGGFAFSPDGRHVAVALADTSVLVYDLHALVPDAVDTARSLTPAGRDKLWTALAGSGEDVFRAMGVWTAAGADAVAYFKARLRPVPLVTEKRLQQLLADLDSPTFARREAASKELAALGEVAEPALRKLAANPPSLEVRRRAELVLAKTAEMVTRFPSPALRPERAVWILERIGTLEARALLETLARGDPRAGQTRQARQALVRLGERPGSG